MGRALFVAGGAAALRERVAGAVEPVSHSRQGGAKAGRGGGQSGAAGRERPPRRGSSWSGRHGSGPCHAPAPRFCSRRLRMTPAARTGAPLHPAVISLPHRRPHPLPAPLLAPAGAPGGAGRLRPGATRQGTPRPPGRSTYRRPFHTRRASIRGTPRGLCGSHGSLTRHAKAVRSDRPLSSLPEGGSWNHRFHKEETPYGHTT